MVNRRSTSGATSRSGSAVRRRTGTTRRRRTSSGYRPRRRTPRTASALGSAFALAVVALFTRTTWPVRIGIVVVALVAVIAYLVIRARAGGAADEEPAPDTAAPPAEADPKEPTP